jgi:hypothetical protein
LIFHNADIALMPDKWEYPWYASWNLADLSSRTAARHGWMAMFELSMAAEAHGFFFDVIRHDSERVPPGVSQVGPAFIRRTWTQWHASPVARQPRPSGRDPAMDAGLATSAATTAIRSPWCPAGSGRCASRRLVEATLETQEGKVA